MKAERRHELKTNSLAETLENLPLTLRKHGSRLLVALLAIVLIVILIQYRMNVAAQRRVQARDTLAVARSELIELRNMFDATSGASARSEKFQTIAKEIDSVLADVGDEDPKVAAEALLTRGDLNWIMANLPPLTGQLAGAQQSPAELLKAAETAYAEVISRYPDQHFSVITAHFGLAGIAENREQWDKARSEYQSIVDDSNADDVTRSLATGHLTVLPQLQQPIIIGEPAPLEEFPSTAPTTTRATTQSLTAAAPLPITSLTLPGPTTHALRRAPGPIAPPSFIAPSTRPSAPTPAGKVPRFD